jgi:spoIIIJ-associated protein
MVYFLLDRMKNLAMDETAQSAQSIADFLQRFISSGALRLRFRVKVRGGRPAVPVGLGTSGQHGSPATGTAQAVDGPKNLYVEFDGPDTPVLLARNGDLLNALEHVATKILRLEAEEHDRVVFDADHFKANRERQMRDWAEAAIERVRASGRLHAFPAMSSRERRTLHMLLSESGLPTKSSGEGPGRFVVLYPEGADTSAPMSTWQPARIPDASAVRKAFRPR